MEAASPPSECEQLAQEMALKLDALRESERRPPAPRYNNWASDIAHPCDRYLVLARLCWQQRAEKGTDVLYRFAEGVQQEAAMKADLAKAGFRIILEQEYFTWPEYLISGKTDGKAEAARGVYPIEIKSVSPWLWDYCGSIHDILDHPSYWVYRTAVQLNTYLIMAEIEEGLLILKTFGKRPRILPMKLNYELAEKCVARAARVNACVDGKQWPERIPYRAELCGRCDMAATCQPVKTMNLAADIPDTAEEDLLRLHELEPAATEHTKLYKRVVGDSKKPGYLYGKDAIIGPFTVTSKETRFVGVKLPPEVRVQYQVEGTYYRVSITRE